METQAFATNHWYAFAQSAEIGRELGSRHVLGRPLAFYRRVDGAPVVLDDACAHRRYPLSLGRLVDDTVECGYHGFTFDCSGRCVAIPSTDRIPRNARVAAHPVHERNGMAWVWIGDGEPTDPASLPAYPWLDRPGYHTLQYPTHPRCHFQLIVENLLDFSHLSYLHASQQGHPGVAASVPEAWIDGDVVVATRLVEKSPAPPYWQAIMGLAEDELIDHEMRFEFHAPGTIFIRQAVWPSADPDRRYPFTSTHFITPDGVGGTWYWGALTLEFEDHDEDARRSMVTGGDVIIAQDLAALEAQQQRLDDLRRLGVDLSNEVSVTADRPALFSRQVLRRVAAGATTSGHA